MIRFSKVTILSALVALGMASSASAAARFSISYNPTYSIPSATPTATSGFGAAGGGAELELGGQRVGFAIHARYLSRAYTQSGAQTVGMVGGGGAVVFHLGRFVDLGLGGYYNYILSKSQASLAGTDYGALGRLAFNIPIGKAALVLGGEYHYALSRMTITGGNITPHDIVGIVGIRFGGGGK